MYSEPIVNCPICNTVLKLSLGFNNKWICDNCHFEAKGTSNYIDLFSKENDSTSEHYTLQWGDKIDFLNFIRSNSKSKSVMPASKLGWDMIFQEIREEATRQPVSIYDAACGFGGLCNEIINENNFQNITYYGADIHDSLLTIIDNIPELKKSGFLLRWDISNPLPVEEQFDYVLCRASLHHTAKPEMAFAALCSNLKPNGKIAISVYNKKSICREASDDALRNIISNMSTEEAYRCSKQFTILGKALQKVEEKVYIPEDLELLGIEAGYHKIQDLIYYHFIKCFYNPEFGDKYSDIVNFDWYHPSYAYRYNIDEVKQWYVNNNIDIVESITINVQHYVVGIKRNVLTQPVKVNEQI